MLGALISHMQVKEERESMEAQGSATSMQFLWVQRSPPQERHTASPCNSYNENAGVLLSFSVLKVTQTTRVCATLNRGSGTVSHGSRAQIKDDPATAPTSSPMGLQILQMERHSECLQADPSAAGQLWHTPVGKYSRHLSCFEAGPLSFLDSN